MNKHFQVTQHTLLRICEVEADSKADATQRFYDGKGRITKEEKSEITEIFSEEEFEQFSEIKDVEVVELDPRVVTEEG